MQNLNDEFKIMLGLFIANVIVALNVSQAAGFILFMMSMAYFVSIISKQIPEIQFWNNMSRNKDLFNIVAWTTIGTGAWIIMAILIFSLYNTLPYNFTGAIMAVFQNLHSTTNFDSIFLSPFVKFEVLSSNPYFRLFTWGADFPVIESMFLSVIVVFFAWLIYGRPHVPRIQRFRDITWKVIWIAILAATVFSIMHWQVRLLNSYSLIVDFAFFFLATLILMKRGQILEIFIIHAIINTITLVIGV